MWLDAGIVPFSTLGWENPEWIDEGYATGAAKGLTTADLPDHAYWEEWFPADWVSEMREQIRLWFYSQLFMSVALTGRAPYRKVLGYEKMLDEQGREMHGSWGNMIDAPEAFARMGADVMRWQYCAQPPSQNLLFGFGPGQEIQRKLLTLWNSASFFVQYANIAGFTPDASLLTDGPGDDGLTPLDRWLVARTRQMVREVTDAYDQYLTVERAARLRGVRRRPLELVHPPLAPPLLGRRRGGAAHAVQRARRRRCGPSRRSCRSSPSTSGRSSWPTSCPTRRARCSSPAGPRCAPADDDLLDEIAAVRRLVELGRQARAASKMRTRQPLRRLVAEGLDRAAGHARRDRRRAAGQGGRLRPGRGHRAARAAEPPGARPAPRRRAREAARRRSRPASSRPSPDGGFRVAGHDLTADEVLVERTEKEGWAVAATDGATVALDLDARRRAAPRGPRLRHSSTTSTTCGRSRASPSPTASTCGCPPTDADLLAHADWIARETLALSVELDDGDELAIARR